MKSPNFSISVLLLCFVLIMPSIARGSSSQYGESGIISAPTAELTPRGVFQFSIWLNHSKNDGKDYTLLPAAISMGVGESWELFGSHPNLALDSDDNDGSLRGFQNLGLKYRFSGTNASNFKSAISIFSSQIVSEEDSVSGHTDYGARLIFGFKGPKTEVHFNIGYLKVDSPSEADLDDEILFGGAIEYLHSDKVRSFLEIDGNTNRYSGLSQSELDAVFANSRASSDILDGSNRIEITPGVRYFFLPNVSVTGGLGFGVTDMGPDYRIIIGLNINSGTGQYVKAIPVIPGSRERYATSDVLPEELMPENVIKAPEEIPTAETVAPTNVPGLEPQPAVVPEPSTAPTHQESVPPAGDEKPGPAKGNGDTKPEFPAEVPEIPPDALTPPVPVDTGASAETGDATQGSSILEKLDSAIDGPVPVDNKPPEPEITNKN